ncbi:MAG: c-type cytochrome domain-containing protein [Planctomycetota bacterium]
MIGTKGRTWAACVGTGVVAAVGLLAAADEPSPRETRQRIDAVEKLLAAGKPEEASESLAEAIAGLEAMQAAASPPAGLKFLVERAARARGKLDKAGVDVSRLAIPDLPAAAPARPAPRRPAVAAGVSFAGQVAPFLVTTCGRCHVTGRKGDFQMASYEQLMRSAKVSPGMGRMSELVEVILSGEMPPGGGVSPDDVAMLVRWIDAGAACDGNPTADLMTVARTATAPPPPPVAAPPRPVRLKPGDVSFAAEVVPVLLAQCVNCHGEREPENDLRMTTLESLIRGGRTGAAIVPGKANESLLVKKLRGVGIEGQRMPLGKPPLADEQIALIAKWIDQGARADLLTPGDSLESLAAAGRSQRLSDGELAKLRFVAGEKLWARVIPDEPPVVEPRAGLCLIGNLPPARMEELATEAEAVATLVGRELGVESGPLAKGGVVVYAFRKAYDYSELWQVVLGSERPKGIDGHAGVAGDVAYGAFIVPAVDEEGDDTRLLLAEQIAGAALAARGLPAWFSSGVGRAIATRVAAKAPLAKAWKKETADGIRSLGSAADLFTGRADPAASALAAGGFMTSLASGSRLAQFVAAFDGGMPFEEAFARAFRSPPQQAFTTWAARNAGR